MTPEFVRAFRTMSSERFILRRDSTDIAALDIHYLQTGIVQSTLVIFEGSGVQEEEIPQLLSYIDEVLLPEVSLDDQKLFFTVVVGRVLGSYQAEQPDSVAELSTE